MNRSGFFLFIIMLLTAGRLDAQTYTMSNGSVTTCSGTFYDSGGSGGNYSNNEGSIFTICPATAGQHVSVTFSSFNLESGWDWLDVYDGTSTAGTYLGGWSGTSPGTITSYSLSGCLTFVFTSDNSTTRPGWTATISCTPVITMTTGSSSTCSSAFCDNGGLANYSNNRDLTYTICPSTPGQYVSIAFSSFNTEVTYDVLYIFDNSTAGGTLLAALTGNLGAGAGTYTASTANSTGCLTLRFISDGITNRAGWMASVSCSATGSAPLASASTNCNSAPTICSNTTFSGNSSGAGIQEINFQNFGCLDAEHQSSWYFFSPSSGGTLGFTISPANGTDDYDFALYGPFSTGTCPTSSNIAPLRCSWSDNTGNTGMGNGANDLSEGSTGNGWVKTINVTAGEAYTLLIDNYSSTTSPFTLTWSLSGGASLDCNIILPIELISFTGTSKHKKNVLEWITATETNNNYFAVERSADGTAFEEIKRVNGAGTSNTTHKYKAEDKEPLRGINYYRLKQVDFDGQYSYSEVIALEEKPDDIQVDNIHPNPTNNDLSFDLVAPAKGAASIEIISAFGKLVYRDNIEINEGRNEYMINIAQLAQGVYTIRVSFDEGRSTTVSKVVKY